jgi:hypothetical protein
MEKPPAAHGHGVLIVAKVRQALLDKMIQLLESFRAIQRPAEINLSRVTETFHPGRLNRLPQRSMVVTRPAIPRLAGLSSPGLAILLIVIPATADRLVA